MLDQAYEGVVLATSSRFYTVVRHCSQSSCAAALGLPSPSSSSASASASTSTSVSSALETARITVTAAQFPRGSSWSYLITVSPPSPSSTPNATPESTQTDTVRSPRIDITQTISPTSTEKATKGRNGFIEVTLAKVLQLAWEVKLARAQSSRSAGGQSGLRVEDASAEEWYDAAKEVIRDIQAGCFPPASASAGLAMGQEGGGGAKGEGGGGGLELFVLADNDFYSQRETVSGPLCLNPGSMFRCAMRYLLSADHEPRAIRRANRVCGSREITYQRAGDE